MSFNPIFGDRVASKIEEADLEAAPAEVETDTYGQAFVLSEVPLMYVVNGRNSKYMGEFQEYDEWPVAAFDTEEDANKFLAVLNDWMTLNNLSKNTPITVYIKNLVVSNPFDPEAYCGDEVPSYYIATIPKVSSFDAMFPKGPDVAGTL